MERLGVFRRQTGPVLQRPVDAEHDRPGQPGASCAPRRQLPSWCCGETLQHGHGPRGMRLLHVRNEGCRPSGKPGGCFASRCRCDDHQKEPRAGAHPLTPLTDGKRACDPRRHGACAPRASPRCAPSPVALRTRPGSAGDGQAPLEKRSSVVSPRPPPCDPKTLGGRQDQRRAIGAWRRRREVKCVVPQRASVEEVTRTELKWQRKFKQFKQMA